MLKHTVYLLDSMYSKKFMVFVCLLIHVWFIQYIYYFTDNFNIIMSVARRKNMIERYPKDSKFILVWNKHNNILQKFGINGLLNCSVNSCVFTDDKNLLYDYIRYDAIIFNEFTLKSLERPSRRSKYQFYIFGSQTSSYDVPACDPYNDNFFNLTFTYKMDSDVPWSYIVVRNLSGALVAPRVSVKWEKSLKPISNEIKSFLIQKSKAAVWLINQDQSDESSVDYIARLQEHLFHYSHKIDAYGRPPISRCPDNDCQKTIRDKYYFYMAFEDSFSVDYVTDVVLNGYNNYAVPVVYGGANYSRFLPPGSYINARDIHPYNLAYLMHNIMKNPVEHETYFRWTNIYSVHDNSKSHIPLCTLCETIHRHKATAVAKLAGKQFRRWWNGLTGMKRCLSEAYWNENAYLNADHIFHLK